MFIARHVEQSEAIPVARSEPALEDGGFRNNPLFTCTLKGISSRRRCSSLRRNNSLMTGGHLNATTVYRMHNESQAGHVEREQRVA